jgi:hypothetical protein
VPTDSVEVEKVAVPPEMAVCPMRTEPSKKETVPVGGGGVVVEPAQGELATVTDMVTVWPKFDGFGELVRVAVADPLTVWFKLC